MITLPDDARLAARLELYGLEVQRAVASALRRAAQATRTETTRRVSREADLKPQRAIRPRIQAYVRRKQGVSVYKAWMGTKHLVTERKVPSLRQRLERDGAFPVDPGARMYWNRDGRLVRAGVQLAAYGPALEEEGAKAWRGPYRQRLAQELARRAKRTTSATQARSLAKAQRLLLKNLQREGEIDA